MARRKAAALLTPGAGADRNQAALVAIDAALSAMGIVVERMDFPYRKAGRRAPDKAPVLIAAVNEAAAALDAGPNLIVGGRSMGGRMCSMAVAQGLPARALILISYPLHPPGKPDKQAERTAHFPDIGVPCLFVSGTRDAFGSPDELTAAAKAIAGPVSHVWIEGGDHGLRKRDDKVAQSVADWLAETFL
jgi:uncharacterized protein